MPVKYDPVPTVKPEEARRTAAIPSLHVDFPHVQISGATGQALENVGRLGFQTLGSSMNTVGAAISSLGKAFDHAGDEMFNRAMALQDLENEKVVNQSTISYELDKEAKQTDFLSQAGDAASPAALRTHLDSLEKLRQDYKSKLTNPMQQKAFDAQTTHSFVQAARESGRHSATETKNSFVAAAEARVNMLISSGSKSDSEEDYKKSLDAIEQTVRDSISPAKGWAPGSPQEQYYIQTKTSKMLADKITLLSEKRPSEALQMLEANKDKLLPEHYVPVYNRVKGERDNAGSRNIADKVYDDLSEGGKKAATEISREEVIKQARDKAERERPGDATYSKKAEDAAENRLNIARREHEEQQRQTLYKTLDVAHGYKTQSGKKPKRIEDALTEPGFKEAYWKLTPDHRDAIDKIIQSNNEHDILRSDESDAIYRTWRGRLLYGDPQQAAAEITADPSLISKLQIPRQERDILYNIYEQERVREGKSEAHTRVERGWGVLKNADYIPKDIINSPKVRTPQFKAVLGDIAEKMEKDQKKPLNDAQWKEAADQALGILHPGRPWYKGGEGRYFEQFGPKISSLPGYKEFAEQFKRVQPLAGQKQIDAAFMQSKIIGDLEALTKKKVKTIRVTP